MALFTIQRNGYQNAVSLMSAVVADMVANGFSVVFPINYDPNTPLTSSSKVVLSATATVDPLAASQPWRVQIEFMDNEICSVRVGSPFQIKDDGTVTSVTTAAGAVNYIAGSTGSIAPTTVASDPKTGFINRKTRVATSSSTFPLNYRLTIAPHGFFLGVFEGNWANVIYQNTIKSYFNWVLVQRPVDKTTGVPLTVGKCPVFCVNKVDSNYWKFVVREADAPHPTTQVPADSNTEDSFKIINTQNQPAITEDQKYLVSFLTNLNTPRFRYTEELDLVAFTSADVIMDTVPATITVYGGTRTYTSMSGSNDYNTGVKLMVLTSGI